MCGHLSGQPTIFLSRLTEIKNKYNRAYTHVSEHVSKSIDVRSDPGPLE